MKKTSAKTIAIILPVLIALFSHAPVISPCVEGGEMKGRIVFSSQRGGDWRIWIVEEDGSNLRRLTDGQPEERDVDPRFSPVGESILFVSTRGGKPGIWRITSEGKKLERIADGDQADWNPDGSKIVFRREERIVVRDLKTGEEKTVTPQDWPHCSGPSWSPDGKAIAFACRWEAGNGIYLVGIEGGEPVKVYDQKGACEPCWSPDGKRLVYETETHICVIQPDGKKNRPVTYQGGVQRYGDWSPDGRSIVYCQGVSESGPWELYIVSAEGGTPIRLTEGGSDMNPCWK
ncbi:MAG: hypothetical protein AB1656_22845 [Candidatus Omnitrophota bacterium]